MISYGRQDISEEDVQAVVAVLRSDFLTQGPAISAFEHNVAQYTGAAHVVAMTNATACLHSAYQALGVGPGSLVWTSSNTFVSTANAAVMLGADVDFVDTDTLTYNLCPLALRARLEKATAKGERMPDVVAPVHLAGQSCDMAAIAALGQEFGFRIVEDASHAIGGSYRDVKVGACQYSDITVFSFHPVKIITTGEGGMCLTQDPVLARRMELFRTHGITRAPVEMVGESEGGWYYQMLSLGYNYRMTDIQAALGLSQMTRLDQFISRRQEIAAYYVSKLGNSGLILPHQPDWQQSSYHLYPIRWTDGLGGLTRRQAFDSLRARGIGVNVHYIPVHLHPFYRAKGFCPGHCPNAEAYYDTAISIPIHTGLSQADLDTVSGHLLELAGTM